MGLVTIPDFQLPRTAEPWMIKFAQDTREALTRMSEAISKVAYWQTGTELTIASNTITISSPIHLITGTGAAIKKIEVDRGVQGETRNFVVLIPTVTGVSLDNDTSFTGYNVAKDQSLTQNQAYLLVKQLKMDGTGRTNPYITKQTPMWYAQT